MGRSKIAWMAGCLLGAWGVVGAMPPGAAGQQEPPAAVLTDRPAAQSDDATAQDLLGAAFESQAAGIAFRGPADCKQVYRAVPDELVEYVSEEKGWLLQVSRATLRQPMPLTSDEGEDAAQQKPGLLEARVAQLKQDHPNAQILRQDVVNIADANVGMIAMRYTIGAHRRLNQQALIAASDQLYYVFSFTTPGSRTAEPDENEMQAVAVFRQVIDSVRLLDTQMVREDQEARLYRTRALFVNLTEKRLRDALIGEQWLRLIQNGKDIGWTYVTEEVENRPGGDGVAISTRAWTVPETGTRVAASSQLFMTFDRKHETWANVVDVNSELKGRKSSSTSSEFGSSDWARTRTLDRNARAFGQSSGDKDDSKQPPVREGEKHSLSVTRLSKTTTAPPFKIDRLPPWYLSQVLGHLLPRVVPLTQPKTYMFASYVSDRQQVMARYVEVGEVQAATLNGKRIEAIPVHDRIGVEGIVTTHYLSLSGKYLGSQTSYTDADGKKVTVSVLPSDAATLLRLWPDADLSRPQQIEVPDEVQQQRQDEREESADNQVRSSPPAPPKAEADEDPAPRTPAIRRLRQRPKSVEEDEDSDR